MAQKADTFWERHPPVGMEAPWRPGLEAVEVIDKRPFIGLAMVLVFIGIAPLADVSFESDWLIVVVWLLLLTPVFEGFRGPRYRLYRDNEVEPALEGASLPIRRLLPKIVASPELMARLTMPEPIIGEPSQFGRFFPNLAKALPLYLVIYALFALGGGLILLLTPPYSTTDLLFCAGVVVCCGAPLLVLWWMLRRVSLGVQVLGYGNGQLDGEAPMAGFDEVRAAALRWDMLLWRPYLLLDLYGAKIRYYSPVKEPLHLLRLAKHRMPHLTMRA